jgi:ectoine hydroxylase-related dioxygenase (phytanoyl-CoA dioxygenase family)
MKWPFQKYYGALRRFKPAYVIFNLSHRKALMKNKSLYAKYGLKKSVYSPISSADFEHLPMVLPPLDGPNAAAFLSNLKCTEEEQLALRNWQEKGFVILRKHFSEALIERANLDVEEMMNSGKIDYNYTGKKIMFAYRNSEVLGEIAKDKTILRYLELIHQRNFKPFQSINFIKSSEQRAHSDSVHMTTYPLGNMAAAWTAFEEIGEDQGPLLYYPGSHRLPYLLNEAYDHGGGKWMLGENAYYNYEEAIQALIKQEGLKEEVLHTQAGDVFIWHANLIHGAQKMNKQQLTRKSMVVHYFADDVICYHELTQRPAILPED